MDRIKEWQEKEQPLQTENGGDILFICLLANIKRRTDTETQRKQKEAADEQE